MSGMRSRSGSFGLTGLGKFHSFKYEPPKDRAVEAAKDHRRAMERDIDSYGLSHPRGKHAMAELRKLDEAEETPRPAPSAPASRTLGAVPKSLPAFLLGGKSLGLPGL